MITRGLTECCVSIEVGEELVTNYVDQAAIVYSDRDTRQAVLQQGWGFLCGCQVCTLSTHYLHTIYTVSTHYLHSIYYLLTIYTISTHYLPTIYTVSNIYAPSTQYLNPIYP